MACAARPKKWPPALPTGILAPHQPEVSLVDQGRRLKRLAGGQPGCQPRGQVTQLSGKAARRTTWSWPVCFSWDGPRGSRCVIGEKLQVSRPSVGLPISDGPYRGWRKRPVQVWKSAAGEVVPTLTPGTGVFHSRLRARLRAARIVSRCHCTADQPTPGEGFPRPLALGSATGSHARAAPFAKRRPGAGSRWRRSRTGRCSASTSLLLSCRHGSPEATATTSCRTGAATACSSAATATTCFRPIAAAAC